MKADNDKQVCSRCVMDTSDIEIQFDVYGVCNHCRQAEKRWPQFVFSGDDGAERLANKIKEIKRRNKSKPYDAVVGLSGGVDSSYAAVLAHKAGLRLLAVHCDTGWNSEEAVSNVHSLVNKLGIDLETYVIDWESMRDLQSAFFFASVPNCDIPQDHAIVAVNNIIAARFGLKDFISGGNFVGESILPKSWGHDARDLTHLKYISRHFGNNKLKGYPKLNGFMSYFWLPYIRGVRSYRILNDTDYNPIEAKKILIASFDWKDYGGKHHESILTRFFQSYYLPEKFGIDKRKAHYSSLIVAGQISRENALAGLREPLYEADRFNIDKAFFLKKLRISEPDWDSIMSDKCLPHDVYPTNKNWYKNLAKVKDSLERRGLRFRRSW